MTDTSDREIVLSRTINAPRELVWQVWTEPDHLVQWWGPDGFTNTFHEIDIRPGGVWRFTMHGPDGRDYENRVVFEEVVKPERLAYHHAGEDGESVLFHSTVTFEDADGRTKVTLRAVFPTAAARDFVVKEHGAIEGGKQTLAKLAAHVESMV